jgi:glycosyltransferase involved in cell wall biosynthesis
LIKGANPVYITDCYSGDGLDYVKNKNDVIKELVIIDRFLFTKETRFGNKWRNFLRILFIPIQVIKLKRVLLSLPHEFIFAHTVYYGFLASLIKVRYSCTPQGSEVLVRPQQSWMYRVFLKRAVKKAVFVTVDSKAMADKLVELTGVQAYVIQNGIDIEKCNYDQPTESNERKLVISIRGVSENYRVDEIFVARNKTLPNLQLGVCCPSQELNYYKKVISKTKVSDVIYGRLNRNDLYSLLKKTQCVLSIPISDSSPRSVYEAIFCGCAVLATKNLYIESLPKCMRDRIVIVDLDDPFWLTKGLINGEVISKIKYIPSPIALQEYSQYESMRKLYETAVNAMG